MPNFIKTGIFNDSDRNIVDPKYFNYARNINRLALAEITQYNKIQVQEQYV